jgi:hypothetical protein
MGLPRRGRCGAASLRANILGGKLPLLELPTRSTAPAQKTLGFSFITKYFLLILDKVAIVRKGKARRRGDTIGIAQSKSRIASTA